MKNSVSTEAKLKRETGWTLLQYQAVKHTYKLRSTASTLTQAYNHITLVVAASDSCFVLMRTHRNGTAPGERSHLRSSTLPVITEASIDFLKVLRFSFPVPVVAPPRRTFIPCNAPNLQEEFSSCKFHPITNGFTDAQLIKPDHAA